MSKRIIPTSAVVLALLVWGVGAPTNAARADECLAKPNSAAPEGKHWYYHTDRKTGHKCWFLRDLKSHDKAAEHPASAAAPVAHRDASKPAAPLSLNAADSSSPIPPRRPQPAPDATAQQPAEQPAEDARTAAPSVEAAPSTAAVPAAQAGAAWQPSANASASQPSADAPPAAAASVWPPVVTTAPPAGPPVDVVKDNVTPGEAPAHLEQPTVNSHDTQNAKAPAQANASPKPAAKSAPPAQGKTTAKSAAGLATAPTPVEMALIVLVGLAGAGFLYHFAKKFGAFRGRQIMVDDQEFEVRPQQAWLDDRQQAELRSDRLQAELRGEPPHAGPQKDRRQTEWRDERPQHLSRDDSRDSAKDRERFVNEAHLSLVPAAIDYSARRPLRAGDEYRDGVRPQVRAPKLPKVNEHDKILARLIRDLDHFLQSRKGT